jgi:hypothetical protein
MQRNELVNIHIYQGEPMHSDPIGPRTEIDFQSVRQFYFLSGKKVRHILQGPKSF